MILPGSNRDQLQMLSMESMVSPQSMVRVIDAFVNSLDLTTMRFVAKGKAKEGRPAFSNEILLKLYIYGYLNRVRSSRRLERECITNIEAIWLVKGLRPCYKTIADFRKFNARAFRKAFRKLNQLLRIQGLFSEETMAIDGSKFRAQNSKKNNYNEKKIDSHLQYIDKQTESYLRQLDEVDKVEQSTEITNEQREEISKELEKLSVRKKKYDHLKEQIEAAHQRGETQISTTDVDARALPKKMNIVEVSYNVVTTCEANNKLITNFEVTNEHDTYALAKAARKGKVALGKKFKETITVLADKGFDTGHQLKDCHRHNIDTLVAPKKRVSSQKAEAYKKDKFIYNEKKDTYLCPNIEEMPTNGIWYQRGQGKLRRSYKVKRYTLPFATCNACPYKDDCAGQANLTKSKGRYIERSEYQDYIDENIAQVKARKEEYRKRQAIVEHPFGTIKRGWGYDYTLMKGKKKVSGEFSLIFLSYNLRRAMSILGVPELIKALETVFCRLLGMSMPRACHVIIKNDPDTMVHRVSHNYCTFL